MAQSYFLAGYQSADGVKLGVQKGDSLYALDETAVPSLNWLLEHIPASALLQHLDEAITYPINDSPPITLAGFLDHQPVWAAGVTYKVSEEARERESANSTVYTRVYAARRPELFWKAAGHEIVSLGESVGIRADASWSVPEPELTIVYNARMEVIGFTIGNDMSSRDIEGENPLYLPQAKVYDRACALGPRIWLQPGAESFPLVEIEIRIERAGELVFSGTTNTDRLNRTLPELTDHLGRCKQFPYGVLLMTGTGVVPPDNFTLIEGDTVAITIEPIGTLSNPVSVVGKMPD